MNKLLDNIDTIDELDSTIKKELLQKNNSHHFVKRNEMMTNLGPHITTQLQQEKLRIADINQQMPELEQKILELRNSVSIESIIKHKDTINTVRTEIDGYKKLVAEQEQIISLANDEPDAVTPLMIKREDLLTDIALGKDKANELSNLDVEIEVLKTEQQAKRTNNKNAINQAEQTINGLKRRISEHRNNYVLCKPTRLKSLMLT